MTSDNLRFYEPGAKVPKEACKEFNNGRFKGTDINRMWRVRKLTEMFGPVGIGWTFYLTEVWERKNPDGNGVTIFAKGELKVKVDGEWSEPIIGYGGNVIEQYVKSTGETRVNDEVMKMVSTDALGHATSFLGIGESVYWNEATKYTSTPEEPQVKPALKRETKTDPFFGKKTTTAAATDAASLSATKPPQSTPSTTEMIDAINAAARDPKTKDMIAQYKRDHNILSAWETTPQQRQEMYDMIRSVA